MFEAVTRPSFIFSLQSKRFYLNVSLFPILNELADDCKYKLKNDGENRKNMPIMHKNQANGNLKNGIQNDENKENSKNFG